jgi:hypothetical protein
MPIFLLTVLVSQLPPKKLLFVLSKFDVNYSKNYVSPVKDIGSV